MKKFCIILSVLFITGTAAGKYYGDYILTASLKGEFSIFSFIFSPSQSFTDTYSLLNSSSDYRRLSGYYAYRESGLIDLDFLVERYKSEDSDIIKKVIIWVPEDYYDREKLVDFYKKLYNLSPENIQKNLALKIGK
ncbi:MAG: hypothetical protein CVV49_03135 [Spirochaetae bacterium HGW-Spirochaetae-5]|nr:MAG: hypothetical protein CVV49_03135 [Spirochaetae bacterium HGW-Spirochaetae-5]